MGEEAHEWQHWQDKNSQNGMIGMQDEREKFAETNAKKGRRIRDRHMRNYGELKSEFDSFKPALQY